MISVLSYIKKNCTVFFIHGSELNDMFIWLLRVCSIYLATIVCIGLKVTIQKYFIKINIKINVSLELGMKICLHSIGVLYM